MKYFAYGELMFSPHFNHIVPNAQCLGPAKIMGYKLFFHCKVDEDPSGKCNIIPVKDPCSEIYGVLYEIPEEERSLLNKVECLGNGYQEITLKVFPLNFKRNKIGVSVSVFASTYVADKDNIYEDLVPFSWYKEMVVSGAREHKLPKAYIHYLEQCASTQDPNVQRANKQKRFLESVLL